MKLSKSNQAIVYAYKRGYRSNDDGEIFGPKGDKLSLGVGTNGYLIFRIWNQNKHASVSAHRFSAYCYYGNDLFKHKCVRHVNGNKTDNRKENIKIGSLSENYHDNPIEWRRDFALKGASTKRKLTSENVRSIRKLLIEGNSYNQIARKFNVSKSSIQQIKEGLTYKWVS